MMPPFPFTIHVSIHNELAMGRVASVRRYLCIFSFTLLVACGGSETKSLTEQFGLQLQAVAWENHMPTVIFPGQLPSCTPLIVKFKVTAAEPLPSQFTAESVSLDKNGSDQWKEVASISETFLSSATTVDGVARGCRTSAFAEGETIESTVHVRFGDAEADVRTLVTLFYAF